MKMSNQAEPPLYKPANSNVANLQLPMWIPKQGARLPVACYWSHDPTTRIYATQAERQRDLELYGYNEESEKYFIGLVEDSCRRHGLSSRILEYEVRHHFSTENKSSKLSELFLICEEAIVDIGTSIANSAYYTSDYRFVPHKFKKDLKSRMIVLDSWDNNILNRIGNADDCEGQDNVATTILRAFSTGRHDLGFQWSSSLLNAIKLYLSHSVIYDVGATVTSAYVDTNNKTIDMHQKDLPMIGDQMDLQSHCDGHCHGLLGSLNDAILRCEQGNLDRDILKKMKAASIDDEYYTQRDAQRKIIVLEPTGSIEGRILPVEEAYAHSTILSDKKKAERLFLKSVKKSLDSRKSDTSLENIGDMFQGEGLQHYVEKQDPRRRISSFYNEVVHATSIDLWKRFDLSMSQFAITHKVGHDDYRYGVKIADFIRTHKDFAFIFPFQDNRDVWQSDVVPFMECGQHQLPLMSFGRFHQGEKPHQTEYYNTQSFAKKSPLTTTTEDRTDFEKLLCSVAANPSQSVVRLYSRDWKFQQSEKKTQECLKFLETLPGRIDHAFYRVHAIDICDPVIEILAVIDVKKCLSFDIPL
jgi:hypothetical protein